MTIKNYSRPAAKMWRDRNGFPQVIKGLRSTADCKGYGNQDFQPRRRALAPEEGRGVGELEMQQMPPTGAPRCACRGCGGLVSGLPIDHSCSRIDSARAASRVDRLKSQIFG
jgi:hypothetical protein